MSYAEIAGNPADRIVRITQEAVTSAINYATNSPDEEVVGVFRAHNGGPFCEFVPIANILDTAKAGAYVVHPQEIMDAIKDTTLIKPKLSNINTMFFHTHPHGMAYPSVMDLEHAAFQSLYSIYSVVYDELNAFHYDGTMWRPRLLCTTSL